MALPRTYAVTTPQPRAFPPVSAFIPRRPGVDVRQLPNVSQAMPGDASQRDAEGRAQVQQQAQQLAAERAADAESRRQETEARRVATEQDKEAKATAAEAQKQQNDVNEARYRSSGVDQYTDAHGRIQPVVDEQGQPVYKEKTGKPQWDNTTGQAYQVNRDSAGQDRVQWMDEKAPIEKNKEDPNDPYIYKKNANAPWTPINPEEGLLHEDPAVRNASAAHLHQKAIADKEQAIDELDIADHEAKAKRERPSAEELKKARETVAQSDADPALKTEAQTTLDQEKGFSDRASQTAALKREKLALKGMTAAQYGQKYLEDKRQQDAQEPDREQQVIQSRQQQIDARALSLADEKAKLQTEEQAIQDKLKTGFTAEEEPVLRARQAALASRKSEFNAKGQSVVEDANRFNQWAKQLDVDRHFAAQRKPDPMGIAGAAESVAKGVGDAAKSAVPEGYTPPKSPGQINPATQPDAAPTDIKELSKAALREGYTPSIFLKPDDSDYGRVIDKPELLPALMANPQWDQRDLYLKRVDEEEKNLRPGYGDQVQKVRDDIDYVHKDFAQSMKNAQEASDFYQKSGNSAMASEEGDKIMAEWQDRTKKTMEETDTALKRLSWYAKLGYVPIDKLVLAYREAGKDARIAPPVDRVLDAAGDSGKQDVETQAARLKALKDYQDTWSDTPMYDEQAVGDLMAKQQVQMHREELRKDQGTWRLFGREIGKFMGQTAVNSIEGMRAMWNTVSGDEEALKKNLERVELLNLGLHSGGKKGWETITDYQDQFRASRMSKSDWGNFFVATAAQMVPQIVAGGGTGVLSAKLGQATVGRLTTLGLEGAAERLVADGMTKEAARLAVKRGLASEIGQGTKGRISQMVAEAAKEKGKELGMEHGIFLSSAVQNGSEYLGNALSSFRPEDVHDRMDDIRRAVWGAAIASVPAGYLDTLDGNERALVKAALGEAPEKVKSAMTNTAKKWAKQIGVATVDFAKATGKEGATGFAQGIIGNLSQRWTDMKPFTDPLTDSEVQDIVMNTIGEAIGGAQTHLSTAIISNPVVQRAKTAVNTYRASREVAAADAKLAKTKAGIVDTGLPLSRKAQAMETMRQQFSDEYDKAVEEKRPDEALDLRRHQAEITRALSDELEAHAKQTGEVQQQLAAAQQTNPEAAARAAAVMKVEGGQSLETMTDADVAALGYERTPDGGVKARKDVPQAVSKGTGGSWIVTDPARAESEAIAPASKGLIRNEFSARAADAAKAAMAETPKNESPEDSAALTASLTAPADAKGETGSGAASGASGDAAGLSTSQEQPVKGPESGGTPGEYSVTVKGRTEPVIVRAASEKEAKEKVRKKGQHPVRAELVPGNETPAPASPSKSLQEKTFSTKADAQAWLDEAATRGELATRGIVSSGGKHTARYRYSDNGTDPAAPSGDESDPEGDGAPAPGMVQEARRFVEQLKKSAPALLERVTDLHADGKTAIEIAHALKVSESDVRKIRSGLELPRHGRGFIGGHQAQERATFEKWSQEHRQRKASSATTELETKGEYALPAHLASSNPRYSYGAKQFTLAFPDDLHKALYILAQSEAKSKSDPDFLKSIMDHTGMTEEQAREAGRRVKQSIKDIAKDEKGAQISVPQLERAGEAKPAEKIKEKPAPKEEAPAPEKEKAPSPPATEAPTPTANADMDAQAHMANAKQQLGPLDSKQQKTLAKFFSAAGKFLPHFNRVFDSTVWMTAAQDSGGMAYDPASKSLVLSLSDIANAMENTRDPQKWALAALMEETTHAVQIALEADGKIDTEKVARMLKTAAPNTYAKLASGYPTAGKFMNLEITRMLLQGRLKITVEGVTLDGVLTEETYTPESLSARNKLGQTMRDIFHAIRDAIGNFFREAPKPLADAVRDYTEKLGARITELMEAAEHVPSAEKESPAPGATGSGEDIEVSREPGGGSSPPVVNNLQESDTKPAEVKSSETEQAAVQQHALKGGKIEEQTHTLTRQQLQERLKEHSRVLAVYEKLIPCLKLT